MGLSTTKFERVEFETMGDALRLRDKYQIIFNTRQKIMSNTGTKKGVPSFPPFEGLNAFVAQKHSPLAFAAY